ncbi:MAG: hypothetical protein AABO58_20815 [Acidobacteriota bacterium]
MIVALFAAVAILAPLLMLRDRALWRCLGCEAGALLVFGALAAFARVLRVSVDPYLAMVAAGAVVLTIVCAFVAFADEVRWSANRAALLALLFYILMIPLMLRTPLDGDEPYYLLIAESLVHDRDLDLGNQFADLSRTASGRTDLVPQLGDRVTPGHVRSHLEPFLPMLIAPGYAVAGLAGALLTIALFGALLARSTVRLFEDEGISDAATRALFPLFAFGPPIVFYAARLWPEVPAAFLFVEAVRGVRQRRVGRWVGAALGLVLLKVRFALVAVPLMWDGFSNPSRRTGWRTRPTWIIAGVVLLVALIAGTHRLRELVPESARAYPIGLFGLALDGAAGIAFQAPLYLFGLIALARWRSMPEGFRLGMASAALYILVLAPRSEWHGGWSPPLRYIVFLVPFLALGAAALYERIAPAPLAIVAVWTVGLVIHGAAYSWRLFHIANGENVAEEWLSKAYHSDFSRLFPSFIRPNFAALVASVLLVAALVIFRSGRFLRPTIVAIAIVLFTIAGTRPGSRIDFEDAHVIHRGGELFPTEYQVARFVFHGGWMVRPGESMSFLTKAGPARLRYVSEGGATIQIGARAFVLPPTAPNTYNVMPVFVDRQGRVELRCLAGTVNLDWLRHD